MYTEHFGFQEDPFGVSPDPRFLYLGPGHHEAFAALLYGVKMRRGFMCLIGEPGTGKTTLLYALLERLEGSLKTVFLPGTDLTFKQRLQFILESLGAKPAGGTVLSLTRQLQDLLADEWRAGSNVVLIFDEAQNLTVREMEDIRLLTNFEIPQAKLLQVILVGQPQLKDKLLLPELAQLKQRITVNVNLRPLTLSETTEYIEHRLRCTQWNKPLHTLMSRPVVAAIYESSRGIPRLINAICHNALLVAYAENKSRVEMAMITEAAQELDLYEAAQHTTHPETWQPASAAEKHTQFVAELAATPPASETIRATSPIEREPVISQPIESVLREPVAPASQVSQENLALEHASRLTPHTAVPTAAEVSEEDLALEPSREMELTLEVSETAEPEPGADRIEPLSVEVGEEILAPETTLAATLKSEASEELESVVEVSHTRELIPELREVLEVGLESDEGFEPAVDLDEEITRLPEVSEEEAFWPEISEEFEPAVDLGQEVRFLSEANGEAEFWPEVSDGVESLSETSQPIDLKPKVNGKFRSALRRGSPEFSLSPPKLKANGGSKAGQGTGQPTAPGIGIGAESSRRAHQVEKSFEVSQEGEPTVFGYGLEPDAATVVATALPSGGRRWLPAHPAGPSLSQLLDELERFASVREARLEHRLTQGHRTPRPPKPAPEAPEPEPILLAEAGFQTLGLTGQQVRDTMARPRLSTPRMFAWALFIAMISLWIGAMLGIVFKHYWPDNAQRVVAWIGVSQQKPEARVSDQQTTVSPTTVEEVKHQPILPPAPVVQSAPMPPLITREAPLEQSKTRTVIVKRGDDLSRILRREYGYVNPQLVRKVQAANPKIKNWDYLEVGQRLNLPIDPEEDISLSRQGP